MQTKKGSLIEILLNIGTGFVVSYALTLYVLPLYGFQVSRTNGFTITGIYTVVSMVRSYIYRRLFVYIEMKRLTKKT